MHYVIMSKVNLDELQASITGENEVEYFPIGPMVSGEPVQFDVPESFTQLTDPHFLLNITAKIAQADGAALAADTRAGPVNLTLHSIFRDVVLKANGVIINQATGTYPYRAYMETVFTYSSAAKNGAVGAPQLYYKDKPDKFNGVVKDANPAFDIRVAKFAGSASVEFAGRLHCDLLLQNKLILPGVRFSLTLFPSTTSFHMMSGTANPSEKLSITKIVLKVRRISISSASILSIERSLQKKPAQYPVRHAVVRTTQLLPGQTQLSNFVVHNGQLPRLIIFALVETSAFTGSYTENPFVLNLKKCVSAQVSVNGCQYPPTPYTPKKSMIDPYLNSLRIARKLFSDNDTGITFDDFSLSGYQILPFDLSVEEGGVPPKTNAVVSFNAQWGPTALTQTHTALFYILWDNIISIDERKNVLLDFIP